MPHHSPFTTRAEVLAYLSADRLLCLECEKTFAFLPPHLARAHGMDAASYRAAWGLPASAPLAGAAYRQAASTRVQHAIADGAFIPNAKAASEAARDAGRGQRAEWELREQAERMRTHAPRPQLPDDATRADGRNAGKAREYQRARRRGEKPEREA